MFVRASELLARTGAASRDGDGKIFWLELERDFHHKVVTIAFTVYKKNDVQALTCDLKVALFDFLLGVVNGRPNRPSLTGRRLKHGLTVQTRRGNALPRSGHGQLGESVSGRANSSTPQSDT